MLIIGLLNIESNFRIHNSHVMHVTNYSRYNLVTRLPSDGILKKINKYKIKISNTMKKSFIY